MSGTLLRIAFGPSKMYMIPMTAGTAQSKEGEAEPNLKPKPACAMSVFGRNVVVYRRLKVLTSNVRIVVSSG